MSWPDKAVREVALAFLVELVLIALKATFHEFLSVPAAVVCKRETDTVDLEIESNRAHGSNIERSEFAGCIFYWHENPLPE